MFGEEKGNENLWATHHWLPHLFLNILYYVSTITSTSPRELLIFSPPFYPTKSTPSTVFYILLHGILACWGCNNRIPQTERLKQLKFICSQFWRPESRSRCQPGWFWWEVSSRLVNSRLLAVSSHGLSSVGAERDLRWTPSYQIRSLILWPHAACSVVSLCDPTDCSLPGSSVHGIFQARIMEWVAISYSKGSSRSRDRTCIPWVSWIGRQIL